MSAQAHAAALPAPLSLRDFQPETPVLRDVKIDATAPSEHISAFRDDTWYLYPMSLNPAGPVYSINFASSPPAFQETLKRLVWSLINQRTPVEMLQRPTNTRSRQTAGGVEATFKSGLRPFTRWLEQQGIGRLCDADDASLRAYADHVVTQPGTRPVKASRLSGVTMVWLLAPYLPAEDRIGQPPWEPHGRHDLLGPPNWSPENKIMPIHPQTISGLQVWALRFVRDFSDDILRAAETHNSMTAREWRRPTRPEDSAKLDQYLNDLRRDGQALPGFINSGGRLALARQYLAAKLDISYDSLWRAYSSGIPIQVGAPMDTPISGRVHGEPWTASIDFYEVSHLVRLLAGACLVTVTYLSGMRGQECLALRRGCCRPARPDGNAAGGFEIIAKTFKGALDTDGNTIPGGAVRPHPWHVIEPVNAAVSIMERLHACDLLFAYTVFNRTKSSDRAAPADTTKFVIEQLIAWCNDTAAKLGRPHETIPDDPEGPVTMQRFRRTLAWFIYRLPAGRISLGIQYGHLEPHVTAGYGSRVSAGLSGVFPMEEALARADRLSDAADRLDAGEQVSGPAAGRYLAGVAEFAHTYPGRVLPPNGYQQLLANPKLRIFDNGQQRVACCYDATKALCHPDNQRSPNIRRSPNLAHCDSRCGNVARTDTHIDEVRVEIGRLDQQRLSPLTPQPMQQAFGQRIAMLQSIIDTHDRNRIPTRTPAQQERQ